MTRVWPRWPSRSAAIVSAAIARRKRPDVRLVPPDGVDIAEITRMAEAASLARDLINTPSNDMGPEELGGGRATLATRYGASFNRHRRRRAARRIFR